ncbi:MAG: hypothetical protein ACKO5K_08895 [Armatimonadota bacterium]
MSASPRRQSTVDADGVDRLVAERAPTSAERSWARIPWRYESAAVRDVARGGARRAVLVVVDGPLAADALDLGPRGAWKNTFLGSSGPLLVAQGWVPVVASRTGCRALFPVNHPLLLFTESLAAPSTPCAIVGVAGIDAGGRIAFAAPISKMSPERFAAEFARSKPIGPRADAPPNHAADHGFGFRLEAAVRRTAEGRAAEAIAGYPVELRSVPFEDELAVGLGPDTAHGALGQQWRLAPEVADRLLRCVAPLNPPDSGGGVRGTVEAEVVSAGRGCRVHYRAEWQGGSADDRSGARVPLRVRAHGYGVFGADRMPRVVRIATIDAFQGSRSATVGVREA